MVSTRQQSSEKERAARDVFARLAAEADTFEAYAHPHAARVAAIAEALAARFGLGREDRANLHIAALAHDLGELAMRRDYIRREGPLTEEERLDLARHPVIGEQEAARAGADRGSQLLVRWHHEWWDGTGYPDALRREQIPLPARILRAADSYAALTDDRPSRRALTEEAARKHLVEWAGLEFDPRVVRALLSLADGPELRSYARRGEAGGREDGARDLEVERAGIDRAETDLPLDERAQAVRAEGAGAAVGGPAEPGVDEWGAPK
ncbi:MAG TPA: HD domain-containing phosphohydrolase [Pyrinomonadaceae bacterium]|nr:HD domain-containing phosphohydrolase [Pyrinomonadaceae bacterium]